MINHVTKGIKVSVKTLYDGSYFKNYKLHFSFNYVIKITNYSKNSVQLKSRHWRIYDSLNANIIIDGEGVEEYYLKNLSKIKNIKYLIFELHNNLLSKSTIKQIFKNLKKNKFKLADKCFNSYYFKKN